jgi:hypothetical protein
LLNSELVGIVGRQRTLCSRFVESAQAEKDGKCVLDYLIVTPISLAQILTAGTVDQILIEHQFYLAHCHGNGRNLAVRKPYLDGCAGCLASLIAAAF